MSESPIDTKSEFGAMANALIERLEKATGPDWELDHEVFAVVRGWSYPLHGAALHEFNELTREHGRTNYTASIDAALTLVPDDCDWDVGHLKDNGRPIAYIMWEQPADAEQAKSLGCPIGEVINWSEPAKAPTPALAICIATMKVRASRNPPAPPQR